MRLIKVNKSSDITSSGSFTVSNVSLTVGITYSQLGRILQILNDSSPFDFPQLSLSVLFQTVKFHVGVREIQTMQILSPDTFA